MFIDTYVNPTTRAPAERNVYGNEYARLATFRSFRSGEILLELAFYKHYVPMGLGSWSEKPYPRKQQVRCLFHEISVTKAQS